MEFVRSFKYTLEVIWDSSKNTHTNLVHKLIKTITNVLTNWKCNSSSLFLTISIIIFYQQEHILLIF